LKDLILRKAVRKMKGSCAELMVAICTIIEFYTEVHNLQVCGLPG
jgi:hypothetical protein